MEQWYKCPECDRDLLYGTNPCTFCKCSLAWASQGPVLYRPPIGESQLQVEKSAPGEVINDTPVRPVSASSNEAPVELGRTLSYDTPAVLINRLKKWQRNQIALAIGIALVITACLFCIFVWVPDARREGHAAGYTQANQEYEARAREIAASAQANYQNLERDYNSLDQTNQSLEQKGWSLEQRNINLQSEINILQSQISNLQSQISNLQSQNSILQNQNNSLQNEINILRSRIWR